MRNANSPIIYVNYKSKKSNKLFSFGMIFLSIIIFSFIIYGLVFQSNNLDLYKLILLILFIIPFGFLFTVGINNLIDYPMKVIIFEDKMRFSNINQGIIFHFPLIEINFSIIDKIEFASHDFQLNIHLKEKNKTKNLTGAVLFLAGMKKGDIYKFINFLKNKGISITSEK